MPRILLSLLLLISLNISAQFNADSLHRIMYGSSDYPSRISAYKSYVQHFVLKNFDTTIAIGEEALELARAKGDSISVAHLKDAIGVASYFKGKYDVAAQNFYAAIGILEQTNEKAKLAGVYNNIAKLYRKTRDLDRSLENYNKADAIFRQIKDTAGIAAILNESGVVFEYRENYDEAIRRYTASKKMAELINDKLSISYSLSNIAGVYVIQKKYNEAEKNLLEVIAIRESLNDSFAMALSYSDLGVMLNAKGDYPKAKSYLEKSNQLAIRLKYPELQSNNYNELGSIAVRQNDHKLALEYYEKRTAIRDSLFALDKTKQVEELNAKYESVKKQQKIDQQHNRIVLQNFLFVGIAGIVLLAGLLVHSQYKRYRHKQNAEIQTERRLQQELATRAVIEAEENERQRIAKDLHDGVGQMISAAKMNLSAFEADLNFDNPQQKKEFQKLIDLVDDSCKEVRTVSHLMMPNALLKNNLAVAIQDFTDKLDKKSLIVHLYTEGLEERLDSNIETVLYRVIQECVTNVIKHAKATTLDISIVKDREGIRATIEDNGKGFDTNTPTRFEGIGLRNIITRIEYLKGTVDFDSAPGRGTVVALHVPA